MEKYVNSAKTIRSNPPIILNSISRRKWINRSIKMSESVLESCEPHTSNICRNTNIKMLLLLKCNNLQSNKQIFFQ